jgi:light-independent protochlorophyllide reductase subunit B
MGFEGANVIFDDWVHPLMMGLEEHLLGMFREDFEFNDDSTPSHLATSGGHAANETAPEETAGDDTYIWDDAALSELKKIPFFVRGKARRNTERFAEANGLARITVETLYDAKAHFGS